jgi:phage-related protein
VTSPIDVAYVEIRPDVDDFDRAVEKDLDSTFRKMEERALKSTQKVEQRFDELETELHENFKEIDRTTTTTFNNLEKVIQKTNVNIVEEFSKTGDRINESFGDGIGDNITERFQTINEEVDESGRRISESTRESVDNINRDFDRIGEDADTNIRSRDRDIGKALLDVGSNAGISLGEGILGSFQGVFNSEVLKIALLSVLIPAAILSAPLIATALSAAIVAALPLGFIGIAIFAQLDNPALQQAGRGFANTVKDIFKRASSGLVDNLILGLDTILDSFQKMEPIITKIFDAIEPLTQPLAEGIGGFIENILPGVLVAVENAGPAIEEFAVGLADLGTVLSDLFISLAEDPEALAGGMRNLFDFIINTIEELAALLNFLVDFFAVTKAIIEPFFTFFQAFWDMLFGDMEDFKGFWRDLWDGARIVIEKAIGDFIRWISDLRNSWSSRLSEIRGFFSNTANALRDGFNNAIKNVISAVTGLPGRIRNAVNWIGVLRSAGENIINGLLNGIRAGLGNLQNLLGYITNIIPDWKGPLEKDRKILQPTGAAIMDGLNIGIERSLPNLKNLLGTVTNNIRVTPSANSLNNFGGVTMNLNFGTKPTPDEARAAGRAAGQGLRDALNTRAVKTAVRML